MPGTGLVLCISGWINSHQSRESYSRCFSDLGPWIDGICKISGGILPKNCEIIFKHSCMQARKEAKLENKSKKWTIRCHPTWVLVLMPNITLALHRVVLGKNNFLGFFLKIWNHSCFQGVLPGLQGRPAAAHLSGGQGFFPLGLSESREGYSLVLEIVKGAWGNSCLKAFGRYWEYVVQISLWPKKF